MIGLMLDRMRGAAFFDVDVYEDVKHDRGATWQALLVVVLAALSTGAGVVLEFGISPVRPFLLFPDMVGVVLGWAVWMLLTLMLGTAILKIEVDRGQVARCLGFSHAPAVLTVLASVPHVGPPIETPLLLWLLVTAVIAVRRGLNTSTGLAIVVILIGEVLVFFALLALVLVGTLWSIGLILFTAVVVVLGLVSNRRSRRWER